jgi:hypothetical protein
MKYANGETIQTGDYIQFDPKSTGRVVCDIENGVCVDGVNLDHWKYLRVGVLIQTDRYGLIHLTATDPDISLISRRDPPQNK